VVNRFPFVLFSTGCILLGLTACQSAGTEPTLPVTDDRHNGTTEQPGLPLPEGFDIRVAGTVNGEQVLLDIDVDIPKGSYVISALSDRDYLGKFQVNWTDSLIHPASDLVEVPVSTPGWEPWDQVYTPMLFHPTTIRQTWNVPNSNDTVSGQVFFVLEPQCVPCAVDFSVVMTTGSIMGGLVHPQYPD